MDKDLFKELGFTEREIKVYIALLELGSTTVGPITKKTKLQAAKVYETLDKLQDKGLTNYSIISKTKHFQPTNPKEILNILEDRKRRIKPVIEELKLKQLYSQSPQVAVIHEGFKAFKALFNRIADDIDIYYWAFAFKDEYNTSASIFLSNFHKKLEGKKIDDRAIAHKSIKKQIQNTFKDNKRIKLKFTSNQTPLGVIIIKNKVINLIWGKRPTAIEITSNQIHQQYKNFFEQLWKKS